MTIQTQKLGPQDHALARATFQLMAEVFAEDEDNQSEGENDQPPGDAHIARMLAREDFFAFAALAGSRVIGGVTAHVLPMTRSESFELFIYDLAVDPPFQRQGVGRRLIQDLLASAAERGIRVAFVPADNEDTHALDFYRAIGGTPSPVTIFTFSDE
jgi:aminoglycoside 3-N-acetyltransferase I